MAERRGSPPRRPRIRGTDRPIALVADPEPRLMELLRLALEPAGYHVVEAAGAAEALRQARQCRPAVVILDVWLPAPGPFWLIRQLRLAPAGASARIVVIAVDCDPDVARAVYDLGADFFLSKPFRPSRLVALISTPPGPTRDRREPIALDRRPRRESGRRGGLVTEGAKIVEFPSGRVWSRRDQEKAT